MSEPVDSGAGESDASTDGPDDPEEHHTTCDVGSVYASGLVIEDDGGVADGGAGTDVCVAPGVFQPGITKPVAARRYGVCTQEMIAEIATACVLGLGEFAGASCAAARERYPDCARCIIGDRRDSKWKAVMVSPCEPTWVRFNQAGCVDHTSGIPGCGEQIMRQNTCVNEVCRSCSTDEDLDNCLSYAFQETCAPHRASPACETAVFETHKDAVGRCFPDGPGQSKELFEYIAAQQCPP